MRMTLNWKTFGILGYMYGCIYSEDAFIVELDCILLVKYIHNFTMAMFLAHNIRFTSDRFDVHFSFVNKLVWLQKCFILHLPRFFFLSFAIHTLYIMMLISLSFHRSLQTRIHFQGEQSSKCSYCAELWFVYAIFFNKHNDSFNCNWWYFNQFQRNNASWKLTFHDLLS